MITEEQARTALPDRGWLRQYVDYATSITDAHIAYHIAAGLSVLSQTLPISFIIPAGRIRGNVYAMIVGPSTKSRKTTAVRIAQDILRRANPQTIMARPGSEERFVDSLVENPQQILFVGEGGVFFGGMENGYLRALKDRITDVYDCQPQARETVSGRKGRSENRVQENPRFSLLIAIADAYLEAHTSDEDWHTGMLARFFTVYAQRERTRPQIGVSDAEEERLANILKTYMAFGSGEGRDAFGGAPPVCLGFDDEAQRMWEVWFAAKDKIVGARTVEATIERSQDMAWKIAGLLAWDYGQARSGRDWYITADVLKPALAITELHIASAIEIGDTLSTDRDMRIMRRVFQAVDETPTPISKILRRAKVTNRVGDEMLNSLARQRRIELCDALDGDRAFRSLESKTGETRARVEEALGIKFTKGVDLFGDALSSDVRGKDLFG